LEEEGGKKEKEGGGLVKPFPAVWLVNLANWKGGEKGQKEVKIKNRRGKTVATAVLTFLFLTESPSDMEGKGGTEWPKLKSAKKNEST